MLVSGPEVAVRGGATIMTGSATGAGTGIAASMGASGSEVCQ